MEQDDERNNMKPWYKKKRYLIPIALVILAAGVDGSNDVPEPKKVAVAEVKPSPKPPKPKPSPSPKPSLDPVQVAKINAADCDGVDTEFYHLVTLTSNDKISHETYMKYVTEVIDPRREALGGCYEPSASVDAPNVNVPNVNKPKICNRKWYC